MTWGIAHELAEAANTPEVDRGHRQKHMTMFFIVSPPPPGHQT